jgi:serine/threonine-protein kinase
MKIRANPCPSVAALPFPRRVSAAEVTDERTVNSGERDARGRCNNRAAMAATTMMSLPTEPSALLAEVPRMVGRFTIREEIGRGSNGVVYSAFDPVLAREVAIKAIPLAPGRKWSERLEVNFLNEAKAAAGLNHPHIVTVFDAGKTDRLAYLAMERLHGRDLHEVIAAGHPLNFRQIASLLARVADAVHFAHKRGLIHRDIKPSNIFIQRDGKPKVLDFGVALGRIGEGTAGGERQLIGTPNYMSPEQALGRRLDARSDVFSIGTILYELLAGRRAFEGNTIDETLAQVISDTPPPIHTLRPDAPARLVEICNRALEKDVERRYQTAGELRNELAAFAGKPATHAANQSTYGALALPRAALGGAAGFLKRIAVPEAVVVAVIGALVVAGLWAFLQQEPAAPVVEAAAPVSPPAPLPAEEPQPITRAETPKAAAPVEPPPASRPAPVRAARTNTATAQPVAAAEGFVALAIAPWGEVLVDGVSRGVSPPLNRLALAPGVYVIEVRNGAAPPFSARVEIRPGQTLSLKHRF